MVPRNLPRFFCGALGGGPGGSATFEPPNDASSPPRNIGSEPTKDAASVHLHSGEYHLEHTDLVIPGRGFDFAWTRSYRSRSLRVTEIGSNWDFSYNVRVEVSAQNPANRTLYDGRARYDTYTPSSTTCWTAQGFFRELCRGVDGKYTLTFPDATQWRMTALDGSAASGKLEEIRDRSQNTMAFGYDGQGRLVTILDTLGRTIQIGYGLDGFISTVTDFAGRQLRYSYHAPSDPDGGFGDLKAYTTPAVVGTPNGNDFPAGKTTTYAYAKGAPDPLLQHNLVSITDPLGQRYVQILYGAEDRVQQQVFTSGSIEYVYVQQTPTPANNFAARKTIVNDRAGNVSEAFFDGDGRLVMLREYTGRAPNPALPTSDSFNRPAGSLRGDDPVYFETRWACNADSLRTRIDSPGGNVEINEYEADLNPGGPRRSAGNLRTRRRQPGPLGGDQPQIVERWEYEPVHNFLTREEDGRTNAAVNSYDAAGNRLHMQHRIPAIVEDWEYNGAGQMTAHVLPDNGSAHRRRDEYAYYASGPQRGYMQSRRVDAGGLDVTTTYEYDAVGNVVRVLDSRGNAGASSGHDELYSVNQLNQVVRTSGREVTSGGAVRYRRDTYYDGNDNVVRSDVQNVDDHGVVSPSNTDYSTIREYDALNRQTRVCRETGSVQLAPASLLCASMPAGQAVTTEYQYDANDNPALIRHPEAVNGDQPGNVVSQTYDERDRMFRSMRAPGTSDQSTIQYDYDANGNIRAVREGIESAPRVRTVAHDGYDRATVMTDAMGNVTILHYDTNGNVASRRVDGELVDVPGAAGNVRLSEATYQYDPMNREVRTDVAFFDTTTQAQIGDGASTTLTSYNDNSQVVQVVDDTAHATSTTYDGANRRRTVTDAEGNTTTYGYDANGNAVSTTEVEKSGLGNPDQTFVTTEVYDNVDRLIRTLDNIGNATDSTYDSRSNRVSVVDALARETRRRFDGLDRPVRTMRDMDGDGADADAADPADPALCPVGDADIVNCRGWDGDSRGISRTDDKANATRPEFDALGRETATQMADCTRPTKLHDVHDNVTSETDANGSVVTYTYDLLNRLTGKTIVPAAGVAEPPLGTSFEIYQYDGLSRLVRAEDDDSTVLRKYDSLSHVTEETQMLAGSPARVIASVYDGVGNELQSAYPGGRVVTTTYDGLDRKKTITDGGGTIAAYDYIGPVRVERKTYGNGTRCDYAYDGTVPTPPDFGVRMVVRTTCSVVSSGAILDDRTYTWDPVGNKKRRKDVRAGGASLLTHDYLYDAADRLVRTTVTNNAATIVRDTSYTLDGAGDRALVGGPGTPDAGSYGENPTCPSGADREMNQYTTTPMDVRTYDDRGNLKTMAGQGAVAYDYADRMVQYTDLTTGRRHTYAYDALGRRIAKVVDADGAAGGPYRSRFIPAGWQEIAEEDFAGSPQATYVFGASVDEVLNMRRGGTDSWYHADDLFNVMAVSNASGAVVERYDYGDFGAPTFMDPLSQGIGASAIANPLLFTGRRYDPETRWYYYRTRYLDPRAGRFTTRDRIGTWGDEGSLGSAYAYCGNNPLSAADPFGTAKEKPPYPTPKVPKSGPPTVTDMPYHAAITGWRVGGIHEKAWTRDKDEDKAFFDLLKKLLDAQSSVTVITGNTEWEQKEAKKLRGELISFQKQLVDIAQKGIDKIQEELKNHDRQAGKLRLYIRRWWLMFDFTANHYYWMTDEYEHVNPQTPELGWPIKSIPGKVPEASKIAFEQIFNANGDLRDEKGNRKGEVVR